MTIMIDSHCHFDVLVIGLEVWDGQSCVVKKDVDVIEFAKDLLGEKLDGLFFGEIKFET